MSTEQSDVDQILTDPDGIQTETDSQELSTKAESVCSEEPSATESVMSDKTPSEDIAVTTTTSVNTTPRVSTTVVESSSNVEGAKKTSPPVSSSTNFLGFLEKLGTGAHSAEIFDESRKDKEQAKPTKEESVDVVDEDGDDDLKMESVPDLVTEDTISIASDSAITKQDTSASAHGSRLSIQSEPTRTPSDAELASLCFPSEEEEVYERQIYCIKDPFSLPSEIHQEIGEMVVMCFEMGVYGDLKKKECEQSDVLKDNEDNTLRTKPVFEVGQSGVTGQCDGRNNQLGSPFFVPKHLQPSNQSEQPESDIQDKDTSSVVMETDQDIIAAEFIKEYFHFLDVTKLRNALSVREDQRKTGLEALINCLQGNIT